MTMTRTGPHLSAIEPRSGAPRPIIRFWMATALEKTPKPQPISMVIGLTNSPKLCRMPVAMRTMATQQHNA